MSCVTPKKRIPRFYQTEATDAFINCLWNEPDENPLIGMPTGTGKSLVIAMICKRVLQAVPSARIIVPTHSQELVDQDSRALQEYWPEAPFGIYAAGLQQKQASMPITFGSIQSIVRNVRAFGKQNLMLIDEAHGLSPNSESNYQKTIKAFREVHEKMIVGGLTATPFRLGQGLLTNGNIFTKFAYDITGRHAFVKLVDMGFLAPLIPKRPSFQFDMSKVRIVGGDFDQGAMQAAVNDDKLTYDALQESLQAAHDRNHWLVYCAGIEHVENTASLLTALGEDAVAVHSKMSPDQRRSNIERFRNGNARMIVNDGILTTGVDFPHVDCIILLRPTASPNLHVQILGRGTRPLFADGFDLETVEGRLGAIAASSKQNCLVLDFSGNTDRCGPINDPRIPKKKGKGTGEVPVKICPCCGTYVHAAQRFCDGIKASGEKCDYEFEFNTNLEQTAATTELIVRDTPIYYWFPVDRVEYDVYTKPFAPPMMRVKYYSGMRRFVETICIEHPGYASKVARDWWRARLPGFDPPPTTADGMTAVDMLRVPTHIKVHTNVKYPKIVTVSWDGSTPEY